ncbi:MAG: hypothetical protein H6Q89_698 [Myxococcaceae bacterium]|nr:hypothetical protein [Myxococcaceae bacterium]
MARSVGLTTNRHYSRRVVLTGAAGVAVAGCFPDAGGTWPLKGDSCTDALARTPVEGSSAVVEVRSDDAVIVDPTTQRATIAGEVVEKMLAAALLELVPQGNPWAVLLPDATAATRIGLKVNVLNEQCATSVALTKALVASLRTWLGLPAENVLVWDRRLDELQRVGFTDEAVGAKVVGTWRSAADRSGPGYGTPTCGTVAGKAPRLSKILTELTDLTINVPVLKTHAICGVTAALKNIYGIIDNPGDYHQNLNTALPELYRLPPIRSRLRFTVLDALIDVTTGGTSDPPDAVPRRLVLGADPLALDSHALTLADALRAEKNLGLKPIDRGAMGWLQQAYEQGLGTLEYRLTELAVPR